MCQEEHNSIWFCFSPPMIPVCVYHYTFYLRCLILLSMLFLWKIIVANLKLKKQQVNSSESPRVSFKPLIIWWFWEKSFSCKNHVGAQYFGIKQIFHCDNPSCDWLICNCIHVNSNSNVLLCPFRTINCLFKDPCFKSASSNNIGQLYVSTFAFFFIFISNPKTHKYFEHQKRNIILVTWQILSLKPSFSSCVWFLSQCKS